MPVVDSTPPMTKDGSTPQACSATVVIDVVVVFPCVPATATARRSTMSEARAPERCRIRSPRRWASTSSGLSLRMAEEMTSVSASPRLSAECPIITVAPRVRSTSTTLDSFASDPETSTPFMTMIRAIPDIPEPPIPMKWTAPSSPTGTMFAGLVFAEVMFSLPARG